MGARFLKQLTFALADSLPRAVIEKWQRELEKDYENRDKILRQRIEHYLDQGFGSCALKHESVANMVQNSLLHFDGVRYRLSAWVVMPNHLHMLLTPTPPWSISMILKNLKSFTSHEANKLLSRSGTVLDGGLF
jgi:REP element-mobilizing transposase RayT